MSVATVTKRLSGADRPAGAILVGGLAVVAAYNAWKWREDRALALRLRAARQRPAETIPAGPRVSILVAAWNEADIIERHIASILALRYPNWEYVLCAGGTDDTYERAKRYERPDVVVLRQEPGIGKQAALRQCLERATGEIVFLTDADCLLDDECFERTLRPILCEQERATTGTSEPLPWQSDNAFVVYQWAMQVRDDGRLGRYGAGLLGRNCAVKHTVLLASCALGAQVRTGTDYHLARRLLRCGHRIRNVPESVVASEFPDSFGAYLRQQARWLGNLLIHGLATGDRPHVVHVLVTGAVGLAGLFLPVAALWGQARAMILWVWLATHGLLVRLRCVAVAREMGIPVGPLIIALLPPFLLTDWTAWAYAITRVIFPAIRWRW